MTTPSENGIEPADLSELTTTDALLDRLGARRATDEDLIDPAVAGLAELIAEVDQSREPDRDAARLIEVLAGRPLYIAGADPVLEETPVLIDLTGPETEPVSPPVETTVDSGLLVSVPRPSSPAVVPIRIVAEPPPLGARRWDRALSHASLPAASVLLLLAIGGGVSAAVTGNPMAPVDGITRVMAQLPGVGHGSLDQVKTEISKARIAAHRSDAPSAELHLANARAGLSDVPDSDKNRLTQMIDEVAVLVPTADSATPLSPGATASAGSGSTPGAAVPTPAATVPVASSASTAPATVAPSVDPVPDPVPTSVSTTAEPIPTSEPTLGSASVDPATAAATAP